MDPPEHGDGDVTRHSSVRIHRLTNQDVRTMEAVSTLFGEVFDERETYTGARPEAAYLERLLSNETFVALAALEDGDVVGALVAYELPKFEQPRSEIYVYDLGVSQSHRRRGIATALIRELQRVAAVRGAWVVFVQADHGDEPAIALYTRLGRREDVLHFDIPVEP